MPQRWRVRYRERLMAKRILMLVGDPHSFVAIGETETIDVFSPQRDVTSHYT
jgi:hypothetical protein